MTHQPMRLVGIEQDKINWIHSKMERFSW